MQNRETNSNAVRQQKIIIENEIREVRTKINNHLDKLQESLMKELTEAENLKTEVTRELLASLDKKQKELTEYQTNIVSINTYASHIFNYIPQNRYIHTIPMSLQHTNSTTRTFMLLAV
jgi:predicted  nucleic acid-binding Zn-ribbon protein